MALEEYRAKRDFMRTAEPEGRAGQANRRPIFVVQEHHASRLHFDFRLEADGVLKSWAVPKEPSLDPSQKRLAVQVEDHPLAYARFKGTIPEGQYGAGTVYLWDQGTYLNLLEDKPRPMTVTEGIEAGKLEFVLEGQRLNGRFTLLRMTGAGKGGKSNWLLIKGRDEHARRDPVVKSPPRPKKSARKSAPPPPASAGRTARIVDGRGKQPAFTNPSKIWFPEVGITKGDVLDYYRRIAPRLLPHLKDRPVTLERLPEGLTGKDAPHFWQKNTPDYYPDTVPRVELNAEGGKQVRYALVNDKDALLYLVNQGTLTFHPWLSRVDDLDRPDFVLFDLDPGSAAFADAVVVAKQLHETLKEGGASPLVKTSGKSGLHVLVPWEGGGFEEARAWAREVASRVADDLPDRATVEVRKASRGRRVYIDTLQNARGHHAVPPYVLRAVPMATVSTPLSWRELTADLDPAQFTMRAVLGRVARQKRDPMASLTRRIRAAK